MILALLMLLTANAAEIQLKAKPGFTPLRWTKGLHLIAGGGVNFSSYVSNDRTTYVGPGVGFKSEIGYYLSDNFAIELGSAVSFNRIDSFILWDSTFTLGARVRIPMPPGANGEGAPYARAFLGWGPAVAFENRWPRYFDLDSDRAQLEGPAWGMGFGYFLKGAGSLIWFAEITATAHIFRKVQLVKEGDTLSEVLVDLPLSNNSWLASLRFSVGIVAF